MHVKAETEVFFSLIMFRVNKFDLYDFTHLTLFSTAFWPTYLARGGVHLPPLGIFDFRAQKSGFKGKAVYHPKI